MGERVFISYSRADRAYAEKLAAHLSGSGVPVWYDHDLGAGQRFTVEIQEQIGACAAFVVVLSPDSVASRWVEREVAYADNLGKPVLPLMVRQCELPIALVTTHYEDVTSGSLPDARFVGRLAALAGVAPPPPAAPVAAPSVAAPSVPAPPVPAGAPRRVPVRRVPVSPLLQHMRDQVTEAEAQLDRARAAGDTNGVRDAETALALKRRLLYAAESRSP